MTGLPVRRSHHKSAKALLPALAIAAVGATVALGTIPIAASASTGQHAPASTHRDRIDHDKADDDSAHHNRGDDHQRHHHGRDHDKVDHDKADHDSAHHNRGDDHGHHRGHDHDGQGHDESDG